MVLIIFATNCFLLFLLTLPVRILFLYDANSRGKSPRTSQKEASVAGGHMQCNVSSSVLANARAFGWLIKMEARCYVI
jgi:hypothetical protein